MTFVVSSLTVLGDRIQTLLVSTFAGLGDALLNFTRSQLPRNESQISSWVHNNTSQANHCLHVEMTTWRPLINYCELMNLKERQTDN